VGTGVKAGRIALNHSKSRAGFTMRTGVKAGKLSANHHKAQAR
jgi:hypothetical protein